MTKSFLAIMVLVTQGGTASYEPLPRVTEEFEELEFHYTGGRYEDELFRYRLLTPKRVERGKKYPILVWLHGAKERGDENRAQLRWLELLLEQMPRDVFDYYVLAVQCPPDVHSWYSANARGTEIGAPDDMLNVAVAGLDRTLADFPIDEDRIYVSGVSSGGSGAWELVMRYPNRFAAAAPMASGGGDMTRLAQITDVPVWAFHSRSDKKPRPDGARKTVDRLNALGGSALLTLVDNPAHGAMDALHHHDCWTAAFRHFEVQEWLFGQRRGAVMAPQPGTKRWDWLNYAVVPVVFMAISIAAWIAEKRRRSSKKNPELPQAS